MSYLKFGDQGPVVMFRMIQCAPFALGALAAPARSAQAQTSAPYAISKMIPLGAPDRWDYLIFDAPSGRLYVSHDDR
jgi:hypothetical protein